MNRHDDPDLANFERSLRRQSAIRIAVLSAIIAAPVVYVGYRFVSQYRHRAEVEAEYAREQELSSAEHEELRQLVASGRDRVAKLRAGWDRATSREALAQIRPGDGGCNESIEAPTAEAAASYATYGSVDEYYFGNARFEFVGEGSAVGSAAQLATSDRTLAEIGEKLAADDATRNDLADARKALAPSRAIFVVGSRTEPVFLGSGGYELGAVSGIAYVYSFASQRIVCAGEIAAHNSRTVDIRYSYSPYAPLDEQARQREAATGVLANDLDVQVMTAIARGLHDVQPAP